MWGNKKSNKNQITKIIKSNIVQSDDMGYPLLLCIVERGNKSSQEWIDVNYDWAMKGIKSGELHILEWYN